MQILRQNLRLLVLLAIAGVIFSIYGCPYFSDRQHTWLCIAVYAVLVLAFIYARAVNVRRRPKPPGARPG